MKKQTKPIDDRTRAQLTMLRSSEYYREGRQRRRFNGWFWAGIGLVLLFLALVSPSDFAVEQRQERINQEYRENGYLNPHRSITESSK